MGKGAGRRLPGGSSGWGLTPVSACRVHLLLSPPLNPLVQLLGMGMLSFDWAQPGSPQQASLWDVLLAHFAHAMP